MVNPKCPNCGLSNYGSLQNCQRCGSALDVIQSRPSSSLNPPTTPASTNPVLTQWQTSPVPPSDLSPRVPQAPPQPPSVPHNIIPAAQPQHSLPPGAYIAPQFPGNPGTHYAGNQPAGTGGQYWAHPPRPSLKQGLAITSLVLGCASLSFCLPAPPVGLILGIIATVKASRYPAEYGGKGMAIGGIALNAFGLLILIPIILAITIPNLMASRIAANEASAISMLRKICTAESTFKATTGEGERYGTLPELRQAGLLPGGEFANIGLELKKNGYRFEVRTRQINSPNGPAYRFEAVAIPESYGSSGNRSFYVSEDLVIRAADKGGLEAGSSDLPLDPSSFEERRRRSDPPPPRSRGF